MFEFENEISILYSSGSQTVGRKTNFGRSRKIIQIFD